MDFLSATEWLQCHAVHILLRHGLSHLFASPVDLEQLKMQWGRRAANQSLSWFGKLSDLQLNAQYLSKYTDSLGVELTSATAGTLEVVVSFSGPSLTLRLSDVCLHVQLTARTGSPDTGEIDEPTPVSPTGGNATDGPTVASRLRNQLKHVTSAVERMLNTLSCRVDRLTIHCSVPPMSSATDHGNTEQHSTDTRDTCEADAPASIVISASCVKLVDTSDRFLAPASHAGAGADGVNESSERPIEITKSFFWEGLKIELAPSDTTPAQQASSSASSSSDTEPSIQQQAGTDCQPDSRDGQACPDAQPHSAGDGGSFYACSRESADDTAAQSSDDDPDDFFESTGHADARETSAKSPLVLFGGLEGEGWSGKATLELAWAAISSGGALQHVRIGVEGRGPAAVAVHAKQLPSVVKMLTCLHAAVAEQRLRAKESATPVVGLQDLTMSMLDALRPEDGLQDVLAVSAADGDLRSSAEASQDAGPRCLPDATPSDSPRCQSQQEATTGAQRDAFNPKYNKNNVIWDVQLSLVTHAYGRGRAPPAVSVSLWDESVTAGSESMYGISLEAQSVTVKLESAPQKPLHIDSAVSGVRIVELLDRYMHSLQGGDSRLRTCMRIPQLLDVAPTSPAPSACVSMEASATQEHSPVLEVRAMPAALGQSAAPQSLQQGTNDSEACLPEFSVWPVLAPTVPAHITTRCKVESSAQADAPWTSKLTVPAYIAVVTPSLLKRLTRISALHNSLYAGAKQSKQPSHETDYGPWSSMFPAPSSSQFQTQQDVNFSVAVPRIFCVLLDDSVAPVDPITSAQHIQVTSEEEVKHTHLVLDLRSARSTGHEHQRAQLLQAAFSPRRNRPLHADIQASSVSIAILSELTNGCISAQCVAGMAPGKNRPSSGGSRPSSAGRSDAAAPAAVRLSVSMQLNAKAARCAVIGDPISMAWAQAEAHRCRDWQLGGGPDQPGVGASTLYAAPSRGLLFPVKFSAAEVDKVAHAGSDIAACVRVPAFAVHTSEQQLKTVSNMVGSILACVRVAPTQQHLPPVTTTMHVAVKGVLSGRVVIDGHDGTQEIDIARAALVLGQGLGGVVGAMVTHLVVTGVRIIHRSNASSAPAMLLLHVPIPNRSKGSEARLEVLSTSCPLEQQQQCGPLRTRTLTSHHIKSATFGTLSGDLSLPWMNHLSSLFQLPAPTTESPVAVSEASTHLSLEDCALAYMPPSIPTVDPNCTAFVAYARGLHTYTLGSARHVDITAAKIAVGRVRSGGVAPWACEQPAAGWSERTCASLGLESLATGDALSVLLDSSATVDSEARDDSRPREQQPSSRTADKDPRVTLHGLAQLDALSGGHIDPLLQQVRLRQAAEALSMQSAASESGLYSTVHSEAAVPCDPFTKAQAAPCACAVCGRDPCRCHDDSCESPQGSGYSRGDSDMEVLSGQDARMMAISQVQLQQLLVTLTPDTCTLVNHLAEQLSAQYAAKVTEDLEMACSAAAGDSAPSALIRRRAYEEEKEAPCRHADYLSRVHSSAPTVALCSQFSELDTQSREQYIGRMAKEPPESGVSEGGLVAAQSDSQPEAEAAAAASIYSQDLYVHQPSTSSHGDHAVASSPEAAHNPPQPNLECSDLQQSVAFGSASTDPYHSLDHSQLPLAQTVFQDASSMIVSSDSVHGGVGATSSAMAYCSPSSAYHSAMSNTYTQPRYPRISPLPDFMHDMDLAGESVVAVGTLAESQLHAAGVPSEQEEDGLVAPELQQVPAGLLGSVMEDYVGQQKPTHPSSAAEPVLGRLGGKYPDSCRRLAVSAACISVLLRPDGIMSTDYAAAAGMVGKGLVRLEVAGARMQHDKFAAGCSSSSRLAVRVRSVAVYQAGFLANRSQRSVQSSGQGGVKWRPLAAHLKNGPSDPRHDVFRLLLQVGASTEGSQEASVVLRLPSLRLHLEQLVLVFLKDFATPFERQSAARAVHSDSGSSDLGDSCTDVGSGLVVPEPEETLAASADSCTMLVSFADPVNANPSLMNIVFKSVEVGGFTLAVDYIPSATDYAALREGSLFELVNLVCWNNVRIDFKTASLQSVHGVQALLRLLIGRWVADIRANQAVRVLEGATPVASFVRLGSAVHRLASHAATLPVNSQVTTQSEWQETVLARRLLHRSARHLLHTLTLEALGLGAWVAGSTAGMLGVEVQSETAKLVAGKGNMLVESADMIRREVGTSLAKLFTAPQTAINQGRGMHGAALAAAKAMPNAIMKPLGATAAAVQKTCVGMQHAVEYK